MKIRLYGIALSVFISSIPLGFASHPMQGLEEGLELRQQKVHPFLQEDAEPSKQSSTLFAKARAAVKSNQLRPEFIDGIDVAENLVQAQYEAPLYTDKSVTLQRLFTELVSNFPAAPDEIKNISGPLTWKEYRLAVERLINWKTPKDTISSRRYFSRLPPSKMPINLDYPSDLGVEEKHVKQGFIPSDHGIAGELVLLLCLAYNVAPYGFPIQFDKIYDDVNGVDTNAFVMHDHSHHNMIYENEYRRNLLLNGGLYDLLHAVPFTSELVRYMFLRFWEQNKMTLFHGFFRVEKEIYPYFVNIYLSLHGSNPFETEDELLKGIVSFKCSSFTWRELPIIFKHFTCYDQIKAILQNREEPKSLLLKNMKKWGLVYDVNTCGHADYFPYLVIFLDQQGKSVWPLLDQAFKEGKLAHAPDADPYKLKEIISEVLTGRLVV